MNYIEQEIPTVDVASMAPADRLVYHLICADQAIAELRSNDERLRGELAVNHAARVDGEFRTQALTIRARNAGRARVRDVLKLRAAMPRLTDGRPSQPPTHDDVTYRSLATMGLLPAAVRKCADEEERARAEAEAATRPRPSLWQRFWGEP